MLNWMKANVYECLQEGWKHDLRNTWWIIDYNRQSLDGVVREGLWERIEQMFGAFGWDVVRLKYGIKQQAAFDRPGGSALKNWIDTCPNQLYSALTYQGGAAWRKRLLDDIGDQVDVSALIDSFDDDALSDLMNNLGGQCVETLARAFDAIDHDRPTAFLAYTIKGWGTPLAGHKDNHAGLMNPAQMDAFRADMNVAHGDEWHPMATITDRAGMASWLETVPFFARGMRRYHAPIVPVDDCAIPTDKVLIHARWLW